MPMPHSTTDSDTKREFIADLFEQQSAALVKYLTARFKSAEEAKEIAQEAWLRIFRLEHPEELDNAKAFLFQTATNLSIDRLRRVSLERKHIGNADEARQEPERETASIEDRIADQKTLDTLEAALFELPLKCRQAFVMHRHVGRSYPEIAAELGVSTSMVEKYIIQALKHFRNKLEQD